MGATTTISVFHHDRYRSCVVPAVRRVLRSGELGPWLQAVWDHRCERYKVTVGRHLLFAADLTERVRLDDDLCFSATDGEPNYALPGYLSRERENLIDLFQYTVENCCLSRTEHMGNNAYPDESLDAFTVTQALTNLMEALARRALVWNNGSGGFGEGIRGWLRPPETARLARELHRFTLPTAAPDDALLQTSMDEYFRRRDQFQLGRIRAAAQAAWEQGDGVLWGNDLEHLHRDFVRFTDPHPAYLAETVQLLARAIRDRREFDVLPVLADALQEAGCENEVVLAHCRDVNEHTDACWVADLILTNTDPAGG